MTHEEEMFARVEIEALAIRYYYLVDRKRGEETAELFSEPCDFTLPGGGKATTRDEVRAFYGKRDNTRITRHLTASMHIEFHESGRATATRSVLYFAGDAPGPHPAVASGLADYIEEYRRDTDGRWKIFSRELTPVFGLGAKPMPSA